MLNASLREQMNRKRQELYLEASQRLERRMAHEAKLKEYIGGFLKDKDFQGFLKASGKRIIFLKSKEGVRCHDEYGGCPIYALAFAPIQTLEKYAAPSHCSKRREFTEIDVGEAVLYAMKLGERRGKTIGVNEIQHEIEGEISGLLKKL